MLTSEQRAKAIEQLGDEDSLNQMIEDTSEELVEYALKNDFDLEEVQSVIDKMGDDGAEIVDAAFNCGVALDDIEEAYSGHYDSDADFAQDLVEQVGDIPKDLPSYIHIDWEWTAKELMMDYSEDNGYYFRNL